jgi:tRNA threonylcarbamoyladenosine dehydratase
MKPFEISEAAKKDKPFILREGENSPDDLDMLKTGVPIWKIKDIYERQMNELFEVRNPSLRGKPEYIALRDVFLKNKSGNRGELKGSWVYFPWSGILEHMAAEGEYTELRTNRNRNLITAEEQKILLNAPVALAGLSIGENIATCLAYAGIGRIMKLAEFDALETSNLNRVRAGVADIGEPKIKISARHVYEANPFAEIELFDQGLSRDNIDAFLSEPKPRIIIELIDNFDIKIRLRMAARKSRIPVLSFANLGDSVLIDVERYDINPDAQIFNGRAGSTPEDILKKPDITDADKHRYAVELVGPENVPERALQSVKEIGRTLSGRPQLASTIAISSGLGVYFARRILLGEPLAAGRKLVRFDDFLI